MNISEIEERLNRNKSLDDQIGGAFKDNPEGYFIMGHSALRAVDSAFRLARRPGPKSVLDYGSGYGTVLRWFHAYYPTARLTAAEVLPGALEFCAKEFGARPYLVDGGFESLDFNETYDCIWLGSVFTHLDPTGWQMLTKALKKHLNPDGLLCFSFAGSFVHGLVKQGKTIPPRHQRFAADFVRDYEEKGFGYFDYDYESYQDAPVRWGRSLTKPEYVLKHLHENDLRIVLFSERCYGNRQDVVCAQQI